MPTGISGRGRLVLVNLRTGFGTETNWRFMKTVLNLPTGRMLLLGLLLWAGLILVAPAKDTLLKTEANVMVELTFTATRTYADPFNEITLDASFRDPQGRELRVPAFWAGANVWKVRYASPVAGTHRFRSECSEPRDQGLHGVTGRVEVKPYHGANPLYLHGPLRVATDRRYLEHSDGTPFFWLGDTWWMGLCHRLHWPDEFKQLTADRKEKGFNVIQIVAGLYPDMPPFDARGANEAGFPWQTNYSSIRPEYFAAADERFRHLVEQGFTPCIVGAWGYFIPWMGVAKAKQHWRYLVARYGAMPVVWCVAGEANLPYYLAKGFPYDDRAQVKSWTEVMRYLRATIRFTGSSRFTRPASAASAPATRPMTSRSWTWTCSRHRTARAKPCRRRCAPYASLTRTNPFCRSSTAKPVTKC